MDLFWLVVSGDGWWHSLVNSFMNNTPCQQNNVTYSFITPVTTKMQQNEILFQWFAVFASKNLTIKTKYKYEIHIRKTRILSTMRLSEFRFCIPKQKLISV